MRIVVFNWRDPHHPRAGGAETYIYEVVRRWVECGHHVHWISAGSQGLPARERLNGIQIHRMGNAYSVYAIAPVYYHRHLRSTTDFVLEFVNSIPFFTPSYVQKPHVALIFQRTGDAYLRIFPKGIGRIMKWVEPYMFYAFRQTPLISLCSSVAEDLKPLGLGRQGLLLAPPGNDHLVFRPGLRFVKPTVLFMNRLSPYKGVTDAIRAFGMIKGKIPDACLLIAGKTDPHYRTTINQLLNTLRIPDVTLLGHVTDKEKQRLLQGAWVHILPSVKEGWGISAMEAAACSTPTVAYDVTGLRDSVVDGHTGLLARPGDVSHLAHQLFQILSQPALVQELGAQATVFASQFTWSRTAEQLLKYIEIVQTGGTPPKVQNFI